MLQLVFDSFMMTIDKFGTHITHKYSDKNGYYLCYIPLHVQDLEKSFVSAEGSHVLTYNINELTNTWSYPLPQSTVQTCKKFHVAIKFIINDKIVDSLEGETLSQGDTILVVRSLESPKTRDGIIELLIKVPLSYDEYE